MTDRLVLPLIFGIYLCPLIYPLLHSSFLLLSDFHWLTSKHTSSVTRSRMYFYQETLILFFYLTTFMPKKYYICPKSLTSNSISKFLFNLSISSKFSPVIIILLTYTIQIVVLPFLKLKEYCLICCPY